jgi:hypothetical protein
LLFVNDTLLFCEPSCEQLCNLRCLFLCFEGVLGLKINLSKSEIVCVGDVEGLASILGCRVASLLMKYLGIPHEKMYKALGLEYHSIALYKASTIWNGINEKTEHKLVVCKRL